MDYKQAKDTRKKSFSNMLADKITSGGGVGSSIKSTISDKTKASMVGLKETFDPMNIAKGIGGKGLAAATGRMLGRKQEDIEYFAGDGKSLKKEGGSSASELLSSIFKIMKEDREDEVKHREQLKSQEKDTQKDEDDWHNKLIDALSYREEPEVSEGVERKPTARKSAPKRQPGQRVSRPSRPSKPSAARPSKPSATRAGGKPKAEAPSAPSTATKVPSGAAGIGAAAIVASGTLYEMSKSMIKRHEGVRNQPYKD